MTVIVIFIVFFAVIIFASKNKEREISHSKITKNEYITTNTGILLTCTAEYIISTSLYHIEELINQGRSSIILNSYALVRRDGLVSISENVIATESFKNNILFCYKISSFPESKNLDAAISILKNTKLSAGPMVVQNMLPEILDRIAIAIYRRVSQDCMKDNLCR